MQLLAPTSGAVFYTRSGAFTADNNGLIYNISPTSPAYVDLIDAGCIPLAVNPSANFRNLLDGGDFTINPWQRGASFTGITTGPTYTADRFFAAGGASSSISVSNVSTTALIGFGNVLQFGRASANTNTAPIWLGQVLETADSIRAQGQYVTFSFWAMAGAAFSGLSGLAVALFYGTGSNQSAANVVAGSWTGQAYPALVPASVNGTAGAAGVYGTGTPAYQPLSTSFVRYSFTAFVPANATQLAVLVGYTPSGTAGSTDYIQVGGLQLEIESNATPFEHRDVQVELEIAQRYAWVIQEPAANVVVASGHNPTSATQLFYLATPVQFRTAPAVTFSGTPSWKTNQAGAATATTLTAGSTHTVNAITLQGNSAGTAGQGTVLQGGGGTGVVTISADF